MKKSKKKINKIIIIVPIVLLVALALTALGNKLINNLVKKATEINDYKNISETFLGLKGKKNLLVLFMNNAESRYGGGFVGSLAYITSENGKIKPAPIRSVYYYDKKFVEVNYRENEFFQKDPNGELYNLRDGLQNLDWRFNGKRAEEIFEKESGLPVDIVIGVTPEALKYFLLKMGPVYLNQYDKLITIDNLTETIQMEVEQGADKKDGKDPKTILSFVAEELIAKLQTLPIGEIIPILRDSGELVDRRQLLIFSNDPNLAASLSRKKIDGAITRTSGDFLLIGEHNFSVDKSNAFIDRSLKKEITLDDNGIASVEMYITRKQTRQVSLPYFDPYLPDVLTHLIRANKSGIRILLPKGSVINEGDDNVKLTKIRSEGGYDTYEFTSKLEPLIESEYKISYTLPYVYDLSLGRLDINSVFQIQNGGWPYRLVNSVKVPTGWDLASSNNKDFKNQNGTVIYDKIVDKDEILNLIYVKK